MLTSRPYVTRSMWGLAAASAYRAYNASASLGYAQRMWDQVSPFQIQPSDAAAGFSKTINASIPSACNGCKSFNLKLHIVYSNIHNVPILFLFSDHGGWCVCSTHPQHLLRICDAQHLPVSNKFDISFCPPHRCGWRDSSVCIYHADESIVLNVNLYQGIRSVHFEPC